MGDVDHLSVVDRRGNVADLLCAPNLIDARAIIPRVVPAVRTAS
jgi:hypothetical protein